MYRRFIPEAGVNFPFTHRFQQFISKEITQRSRATGKFVSKYGEDFDLIFNMSAMSSIKKVEIKGPTVFKRDKDVEYTIFLPWHSNEHDSNSLRTVVHLLISGIIHVFGEWGIDSTTLSDDADALVERVINDPSMIE
ncbi:MAG: hypothetical protein KatS3mg105_3224 [Gemmatales bacterium]|nr:MAG: hypothetical protein KatS3mg105_3224 [Gemmatales bacterium]